jgi:orotidine-5'-phosphate decarboxylase
MTDANLHPSSPTIPFFERVAHAVNLKNNVSVAGLDPVMSLIPDSLKKSSIEATLVAYNTALIDSFYDIIPVVKLQLACYEAFGLEGMHAYVKTVAYAKQRGLLVIADAKRGDIGSTAARYAHAFLEAEGDFVADALTVNAYLGSDGVLPFIEQLVKSNTGIFVLVKTSNPSSGELQDLIVQDGRALYEVMADYVVDWGKQTTTDAFGYHQVGAVVGATYPDQLKTLRKRMPGSWLLLPGYGAQGAVAEQLAPAFNASGQGALVNASRSIMGAHAAKAYQSIASTLDGFAKATRMECETMLQTLNDARTQQPNK